MNNNLDNEEKLLTLLNIAKDNGYNGFGIAYRFINKLYLDCAISKKEVKIYLSEPSHIISLNDLIGNFEIGETSFIDALQNANIAYCKQKQNEFIPMLTQEYISNSWFNLPTSERLDWLFFRYDFLINK